MKIIHSSRIRYYLKRVSVFLVTAALIAGMVSCVPTQYDLTISSTAGGNVTIPGEGMFTCSPGMVVGLVAEAEGFYRFDKWTGDVGTIADDKDPTTTITMNGDYTITANFERRQEPPPPLIISTARDTDEQLAIFEMLCAGPVMREFVAQVNAGGGVYLSEYDSYFYLEIDRREINVATWDIATVTQGICADIAAGDSHFLLGGPGTDCIFTQAPIANANEVVLLTLEGGSTSIANDPNKLPVWPYVFLPLSYSDWYQLPVLSDMLEAELAVGDSTVKAYVVHIEGEHGDDYLAMANVYFDVVASVQVPFNPALLAPNAVIAAAKAALNATPYDIFCCFAYPDHVLAITDAAMANAFDPPAMIFGPGANFGFYPYAFGDPPDPALVEGIMTFAVASYNQTNTEITAVYDAIAARMDDDEGDPDSGIPAGPPGILSLDYWGIPLYWAGLEMWLAAVENVGYVSQELLRDALADTEANPVDTVLADETWFRMSGGGEGGGNLDYLCHTGEIGQWQNATLEIVGPADAGQPVTGFPNYVVTANFTFPMTDLWGWLP